MIVLDRVYVGIISGRAVLHYQLFGCRGSSAKGLGSDVLMPTDGHLFARWILPILAAAAIGYFTNWLAIKMLFEPYEPRRLKQIIKHKYFNIQVF